MKKVLIVADRPGWAIDKLTKPISEIYLDEVDLCYLNTKRDRFLMTGYSEFNNNLQFSPELMDKYEVVHFHHYKAAIKYPLSNKYRKVISCCTEVGIADLDWKPFDAVIAPTKYCYEIIRKQNPNTYWIPWGINQKKYQYYFGEPQKTVGFVGRIIEHKRYHEIQKAAFEAKIRFVGTGYIEQREYFQKNKGIEIIKDYEWVNLLPEVQMPGFYNRLGIFVCLSRSHFETGPLPVLEAMACGVPVISTPVGWAKDWATHNEDIIFINEEDVWKLSDFIKQLWDNGRMRRKLRDNAMKLVSGFTIEKYAENFKRIYEGKSSSFKA